MRPAEVRVSLRATLVLLGLWATLALVSCSQGRPSWHYASSEVVIPRRETHRGKGLQLPGWLSYSLHFGGERHVLHMRRKRLLWPRHMLMTTQDDQGALQMDYPYIPADCYYLGYLEEVPLSMVTVDTCYGGLSGILKLDDLAYEIKPLQDSPRFEHVVSQIVAEPNATGPTFRDGENEQTDPRLSEANDSMNPRISNFLYSSHPGNIKGHIQCSNSYYRVYNNITACSKEVVRMFSLVDSIAQNIDLRYCIYLLTIYNNRDPAPMNDYRTNSAIFTYYRTNFFTPFQVHISILLIQDGPHESNYAVPTYKMCKNQGVIHIGILSRHYLLIAVIIMQSLMRSIGVEYDESYCTCQRRTSCIMQRYPGMTDAFSNCTYVHAQNCFSTVSQCIFITPSPGYNETLTKVRCGNLIVEENEQCDCGSFKQCYASPCCTSDCRFTPGSICHIGDCCTNCSFSPPGTLCRPIQNICDLPEYCRGTTWICPPNVYMQDGTPCTEEGYCYHGNCTDRNLLCKAIFGVSAENAPDDCYNINLESYRFGHCTRLYDSYAYQSCVGIDKFCGRLQCTNVTHLPWLQEHASLHHSVIGRAHCFGLDEHRGMGTTDVGRVIDGTPCVRGNFCNQSRCNATIASLGYDCRPEKCSHRGVCNNRRNCHCHVGWDPPRCLRSGAGGSVDSGPPPKRMRSIKQSELPATYLRVVFGRIYAFIIALLFGIATNVRTIRTTTVKEVTVTGPK
ncbi:disintegrin and metalloproteinase domain-containing protein 20-like [Saimiri boliviensis]|uniref:disintegrin and metalloproteinase domain-containing protein 20-like n=1 Tax=Saimiri boliviensis TaxID=27679 RepID=UPI00193CCCFE|nr:disintegrin and metalloproteinase domain-containing protein 20-like [Saimiri boliviensis boliviensis]